MTRLPRSPTPTRATLRHPTIALLAVLGLALLAHGGLAETPGSVASGTGTWHGGNATRPADAEWSYLGKSIGAYRVTVGDEVLHCVHGHLVRQSGGASHNGTCSGDPTAADRVALRARTDTTRWNGTFVATTTQPFGAGTDPGGSDGWNALGITVTATAATTAAAALLLLVLYLRERRFKDYLVRRLYEETQGRFPYDLPEGQSRELYARILVKGKN